MSYLFLFRCRKLMPVLLWLGICGAVSHSASAQTQFYVSTTGSDANPGTLSQPWRTIQKSMNSATAGSTVNVMAGTYQERLNLNVSGTAGNPIVYQPYGFTGNAVDGSPGGASIANNGYKTCSGDQVILDYTYLGDVTSDSTPFLYIDGPSYVTIRGFTFQNYTCDGGFKQGLRIDNGSHDILISKNRFLHNHNIHGNFDGTSALLHIRIWSDHVTIDGNEIGDIWTSVSEAMTVDSSAAHDVVIQNNYVHDTDGIGIDVHQGANSVTVRGNLLQYISNKPDGTVFYNNPSNAIYVDGGNNVTIEKNVVRNSEYAIAALAEPGQPFAHDIHIRDNVVHNNGACGIMLGNWYSTTDGSILYNTEVLNNTVYANQNGFIIRPYTSASVTWKNNVLANNSNTIFNSLNWPVGTMDYNLYYGTGAGPDAHKVTTDPQFNNVSASPPDFSLKSTSPARDAGDPFFVVGTGETSFLGGPRLINSRVDMGAFEYASVAPTPTPTPTPAPTPAPTPVSSETLFLSSQSPAASLTDNPVELGVTFSSAVNGTVTAVRFYKSSGDQTLHTVSLWNATSHAQLATKTATSETSSGWQNVAFTTPVPITAGTLYTASFHTSVYGYTSGYFVSSHASGDLTAGTANGVYTYNAPPAYPGTVSTSQNNYWVDVGFVPANPTPTPTPTPTPAPIPPAITNLAVSNITVNGATISWNVSPASTGQVAYGTTTAYGGVTTKEINYLTFHSQVLSGLAPSTLYHYKVVGNDINGNQITAVDNTFTTAVAPTPTPSPTPIPPPPTPSPTPTPTPTPSPSPVITPTPYPLTPCATPCPT